MVDRLNTENILANKCQIQLGLKILARIIICEPPFEKHIVSNNSSKNISAWKNTF
jgi:hypothetical protein